ncbi:MAG TPA: DUF1330 domain-containing protein [Solirubrobacteraceae bacterium]|nr:DUF1330 domain-containing protein [Solirubrobacteraceae bacterium]
MHIDPTPEQAQAFGAQADATEPVFMLNLLRFKERADGIDADEGLSGIEAYQRYAAATAGHLQRVGGELLWAGVCGAALIGPSDVEWDVAAVVRYPSRSAFLEMVSDADYQATTAHRSAGLADSRLIPCAGAPFAG